MAGEVTHEATRTEQQVTQFIEELINAINVRKNNGEVLTQQNVADMIEKQLEKYENTLNKTWAEKLSQIDGSRPDENAARKMLSEIRKDIGGLDFAHYNLQVQLTNSITEKTSSERQKLIDPHLQDKLGASILLRGLAHDLRNGKDQGGKEVRIDMEKDSKDLKIPLTDAATKFQTIDATGKSEYKPLQKNEHWDKIREYTHMRNEYLSAKIKVETTKKALDTVEKNLNKLHNQSSALHRFFHGGKKPDKVTHLQQKLALENQRDKLKLELKQAKETVEKTRENSILPSRSHHITQKLTELIKDARKEAIELDRNPLPPDRGNRYVQQPVQGHVPGQVQGHAQGHVQRHAQGLGQGQPAQGLGQGQPAPAPQPLSGGRTL
jgi:hypothetical protein